MKLTRDESLTVKFSWLERLVMTTLKRTGPIPRHIAFIMDGNRRFARQRSIAQQSGHRKGFDKLNEVLQWCEHLGITEVSVYAFSIENFKRADSEVDLLMQLASEKLAEMLDNQEYLAEHSVRIRFHGNLSLLPPNLQRLMEQIHETTQHNSKSFLNICFAYTSSDQIARTFECVRRGVAENRLLPGDVTQQLLDACLNEQMTRLRVDMVLRTSEVRLSDFLMWQLAGSAERGEDAAYIQFLPHTLWPNFTLWQFFKAILRFQLYKLSRPINGGDSNDWVTNGYYATTAISNGNHGSYSSVASSSSSLSPPCLSASTPFSFSNLNSYNNLHTNSHLNQEHQHHNNVDNDNDTDEQRERNLAQKMRIKQFLDWLNTSKALNYPNKVAQISHHSVEANVATVVK